MNALAVSTTPNAHFATLRYSSWLTVNGETWIYAEAACAEIADREPLENVAKTLIQALRPAA